MNIGCIYTVETYNSVEKPLSVATEIPFGISIIATMLKQAGYCVELFVITPDTPLDDYFGKYLQDCSPSMFCMTAVSTQYWKVKEVAEYINNKSPNTFCVLGGHHSSLNSEDVMKEGIFDAICIGEGEKAVLELAESVLTNTFDTSSRTLTDHNIHNLWFRDFKTGKVYKNPSNSFLQNLDNLPYIDRSLWEPWIERADDYPAVLLGRGCPFKCTYCSNHAKQQLSNGKYVRFRSPVHIIGEIKYIKSQYPNVERVYLEVETFGANRKASYVVFDSLAEYNKTLDIPIKFGVNMALTSNYMMNSSRRIELFEKVVSANITTINIGLESGSERIREIIKRPHYSNVEIIAFCQDAKKYNIRVIFFVLIGLPGETVQDYKQTVKVARLAQPYLCYVSIFYPYLGTELAKTAITMGLVDRENLSPKGERSSAQLDLPQFSKNRIRFEYIIFAFRVYRGNWPISRVLANVFASFLKAYPKMYSTYLKIRNNIGFVMKLSNKYSGSEHKLAKIKSKTSTREDVISD